MRNTRVAALALERQYVLAEVISQPDNGQRRTWWHHCGQRYRRARCIVHPVFRDIEHCISKPLRDGRICLLSMSCVF
jgi:hypothetical protein